MTDIYVVGLTDQFDDTQSAVAEALISPAAVDEPLAARSELTIDEAGRTAEPRGAIGRALGPVEVQSIGLSKPRNPRPPIGEFEHRIGEYYKTWPGDARHRDSDSRRVRPATIALPGWDVSAAPNETLLPKWGLPRCVICALVLRGSRRGCHCCAPG